MEWLKWFGIALVIGVLLALGSAVFKLLQLIWTTGG